MKFESQDAAGSPARRQAVADKRSAKRLGAPAIAAAALALCTVSAYAYDVSTSPYLFGDWGGLRTRLAAQGVAFNLGYGSELAHNSKIESGLHHIEAALAGLVQAPRGSKWDIALRTPGSHRQIS